MKVSFFPAVAAAFTAITVAGCGGSGGGTGNSPSFGPLVGTWRATALSGGGPDTPCPTTFATSDSNGTLSRFGCGSNDTLVFKADGTFTGYKAPVADTPTTAQTFTGRWSQFQLRALLTVDGEDGLTTFPYSTTIQFRNENQFALPAAGFNAVNRFIFTRQ